jgi:hypothetical protein
MSISEVLKNGSEYRQGWGDLLQSLGPSLRSFHDWLTHPMGLGFIVRGGRLAVCWPIQCDARQMP